MKEDSGEISTSSYALRRKELLSHVKQLRAVGAQTDLDLPRVVVIGNQSAGKSSVVEAISGITVPRDAGTCTRCPMECRLSSSGGPWSCQVSIRWEFDRNGKLKDKVSEAPFGKRITDKSQVEPTLRRAQTAVLNPDIPSDEILEMDIEDLNSSFLSIHGRPLLFSRNVVCVDLEGPDLTDLSFIDLPGIIQNAEPDVVKLVEDLVVSNIKGNCLILVALPMTDDIENQKALRLAHREDPAGRRTIGVITKPDMLTAGSIKARELWLNIIEGRCHVLEHGYYCTRQPDDAERSSSISNMQARQNEKYFFENTTPWSTSNHQHRFGIQNLTSRLSDLLVRIIDNSLPNIRSETTALLEACESELMRLPKPIQMEPAAHMLNLITALCEDVQQYVRGGTSTAQLVHENRAAFGKFKTAIRHTAPNFVPFIDASHQSSGFENCLGEGLDEGPDEGLVSEGQPFYLDDMKRHIEKSIMHELPNSVPFDAKLKLIKAFQNTWAQSVRTCFDSVRESTIRILDKCVDERFKQYDRLLIHVRSFISELVKENEVSCLAFLHAVLEVELKPFTQNLHYLESTTEKWLAKYKEARSGKMRSLSPEPPLKKQKQDDFYEPEDETPPPTPSRSAFSNPSNKANGKPKQTSGPKPARRAFVFGPSPNTPANIRPVEASESACGTVPSISNVLAALAEFGYSGLTQEDLGKLNPSDEYETELKVMAEVRGYFQVSYKRLIDNVPSFIVLKFVNAVGRGLEPFLISRLGVDGANASERCEKYLTEHPGIVARRAELTGKKRRLGSVARELSRFEM